MINHPPCGSGQQRLWVSRMNDLAHFWFWAVGYGAVAGMLVSVILAAWMSDKCNGN